MGGRDLSPVSLTIICTMQSIRLCRRQRNGFDCAVSGPSWSGVVLSVWKGVLVVTFVW